ncbi:MFS transporter [Amycolatopsis sp. NPDC004079]|uniref:MFS transporter n=1 Tax=Amycolatopsis sp. NPDC004079 TaxID=3154549 RepID=UPI0033AFA093
MDAEPAIGTTPSHRIRPPVRNSAALIVLLASAALGAEAGAVLGPVVVMIRDEFRLSPGQAGLVIAMHGLLIAACAPVAGTLVDRIGTKRLLAAALVAYGVFGGLGALSGNYPLLLLIRALFGVAVGVMTVAYTVGMLTLRHGRDRATVMGYQSGIGNVGQVLWPLLAGIVGGLDIGWRGPFLLYLIALPLAAAAVWLVPDTRRDSSELSGRPADAVRMRSVIREAPVLLWLYALIFVVAVLLYALVAFLPQRLSQLGVSDPLAVAGFLAAATGPAAVVGMVYGRLQARLRPRTILVLALALPAAGFALLSLAAGPLLLLFGSALIGVGIGLVMPAVPTLASEAVTAAALGRATSWIYALFPLGNFAAPLLLGPLASGPFGFRAVFGVSAAISLLSALGYFAGLRRVRFGAKNPSGQESEN